ncbi:MAG: serine--tRNA ligase [Luteibaculaceae bacterium]
MLVPQFLREYKEQAIIRLGKRNLANARELVEKAIELDDARKLYQTELDEKLAELNRISKTVGALIAQGKQAEAEEAKKQTADLKVLTAQLKQNLVDTAEKLTQHLYNIPNLPYDIVKQGRSAEDNDVVFEYGTIKKLGNEALPHWDLATKYHLIDFELGVKVTGAGFPFFVGKGAKLQRALINYFLDKATAAGYVEMLSPLMVNEASGYGTGQLPDKEGQMYHVTEDNLYLIPTAEVPLTNTLRDVLLDEKDLPIKLTGYTPCFRREAGSYGKDVRGLNRLHQFDKVEIVQVVQPEESYTVLGEMVEHVKNLLISLELPFRILRLCGGDMGFTSALTYDFEVYSEAQERWLEVSSVSNFESFQANRLKLRYKNKDKQTQLLHTLNGSALALPRIVAALLENHQTKDGINIPKALIPYTNFEKITL